MSRTPPWVGVVFMAASLLACVALCGALGGLLYDRVKEAKS